uniref:Uncharacterized protein n=1 Tax=Leersia perrieri TaxID=77586 RepID=A0A0D9WRT5_9ORYZ
MADDTIPYLGRRINQQQRRGGAVPIARDHRRMVLDSGCTYMVLGIAILMRELMTVSAAKTNHTDLCVLVAFLLWLLGASAWRLRCCRSLQANSPISLRQPLPLLRSCDIIYFVAASKV